MSDLISRAAVLDEIHKYMEERDYTIGTLYDNICEMPSAQPTDAEIQRMQDIEQAALEKAYECGKQDAMRWIPCKELLPSDYQWYYATCKSLVDNRENWVVEGCYTPWEHFNSTPMIKCGEAEVIAWMPKESPEPYKEKE